MKKLLLTISAIGLLTSGLFAQQYDIRPEHQNIRVQGKSYILNGKTLVPSSRGVNDISTWYNFVDAYEEGELLGQSLSTFVSFIYPDTTAYIVYADGSKTKIGFHVLGSTFDPKDTNYQAAGLQTLTKFNPYTVDSLAWTQFYIRQLDSVDLGGGNVEVVDTLFIQYFDVSGMEVKTFVYTNQTPQIVHYYGIPKQAGFSQKTLRSSGAVKTDTLLLTKANADSVALNGDQTQFFGRVVQIPTNYTAKSTNTTPVYNNITAFAVNFAPMVKTTLGDTLIAYNGTLPTKKYNMFGMRLGSLTGHDQVIKSPYRINNFFVTNYEVRYGQTISTIFKSYLPGTIFTNTIFMPHWEHITTTNLATKQAKLNGIGSAVAYPNPVAGGNDVQVLFDLNSNSSIAASITDINGRVVKTFAPKVCATGVNSMVLETAELSKGMYMVVLEGAAGKTSIKLNVQ
jgi:hypothetical protein